MKNKSKYYRLINSIFKKTRDGSMSWEETDEDDVFQVSFPDYSLRISRVPTRSQDPDGEDIILRIYNNEGKLIDEVDDAMIYQYDPERRFSGLSSYQAMYEIYNIARRQALGVEQALDSLLNLIEEEEEEIEDTTLSEDEIPF